LIGAAFLPELYKPGKNTKLFIEGMPFN